MGPDEPPGIGIGDECPPCGVAEAGIGIGIGMGEECPCGVAEVGIGIGMGDECPAGGVDVAAPWKKGLACG